MTSIEFFSSRIKNIGGYYHDDHTLSKSYASNAINKIMEIAKDVLNEEDYKQLENDCKETLDYFKPSSYSDIFHT